MELKESKTAEALQSAFAAESQAYNRYIYSASAARKASLEQVADIFLETARSELPLSKLRGILRFFEHG
jgi:rubrerythrin